MKRSTNRFDEAFTGFLDHLGLSYSGLIGSGYDVQVAHSVLDEVAAVFGRNVCAVVSTADREKRPVPDALRAALTATGSSAPAPGRSGRGC